MSISNLTNPIPTAGVSGGPAAAELVQPFSEVFRQELEDLKTRRAGQAECLSRQVAELEKEVNVLDQTMAGEPSQMLQRKRARKQAQLEELRGQATLLDPQTGADGEPLPNNANRGGKSPLVSPPGVECRPGGIGPVRRRYPQRYLQPGTAAGGWRNWDCCGASITFPRSPAAATSVVGLLPGSSARATWRTSSYSFGPATSSRPRRTAGSLPVRLSRTNPESMTKNPNRSTTCAPTAITWPRDRDCFPRTVGS